ncbi:MAG: signal peptidase II [Erysipelotrichaceae bacterium]|nr:signal peptidase II [Erysipelotrichaceae bacterium]
MTYAFYVLFVTILVIIDQYVKNLVVTNIELGKQIPLIDNFFSLTYVRNYGAGFSILQNERVFLTVLSIIAIAVLSYLLIKAKKNDTLSIFSYILIISGALGNLIDRIRLGYVVDFLDFKIFGYDYPVFNLADSFITVGCFILIIMVILETKNAKNKA